MHNELCQYAIITISIGQYFILVICHLSLQKRCFIKCWKNVRIQYDIQIFWSWETRVWKGKKINLILMACPWFKLFCLFYIVYFWFKLSINIHMVYLSSKSLRMFLSKRYLGILFFQIVLLENRRTHIRHQSRKTTVLSCHRCLIYTGVEKVSDI